MLAARIARTVALRAVGGHLVKNHLARLGVGTLQSIVEGVVVRVSVAAFGILYAAHPEFRMCVNDFARALF